MNYVSKILVICFYFYTHTHQHLLRKEFLLKLNKSTDTTPVTIINILGCIDVYGQADIAEGLLII